MKKQVELIHKFDWDVLIILDSMRYDVFREIVDLGEAVWSSGSTTDEWLANTWKGKYNACYITANPFVSNTVNPAGWRASDHFAEIIPVWDFGWKKVKGCYTVPPEEVVKAYRKWRLRGIRRKVILHFMQPHSPFISEKVLPIPWIVDLKKEGVVKLGMQDGRRMYQYWVNKYGAEYVREAYKDNARLVLSHVIPLAKKLVKEGKKVIITSDHGELLGENGLWGHLKVITKELRIVPWLELKL